MVGWKRIAELLELSNKNSESSNYLHRLRNREIVSQLRKSTIFENSSLKPMLVLVLLYEQKISSHGTFVTFPNPALYIALIYFWFSGRRERTAFPARQISRSRISCISFSYFSR